METILHAIIVGFAALLAFVTVLPLSGSHAWWVRLWDFPRLQIAVALAVVLVLALLLPGPVRWIVLGVTAACLAYQAVRLLPFTPLAQEGDAVRDRFRARAT